VYDLTLGGTPSLVQGGATAEVDPGWSPDGAYIAYASSVTGAGDVYLLRVSDGAVTRLTSGATAEVSPTWTTDGRIVYLEFLAGGGTQIRWLDPFAPGIGAVVPVAGGGALNRPHAVPLRLVGGGTP
jgi:Tol biopolymer transport system component